MNRIEDVADILIYHSENGLTHKKLQKLLYLAQGFYIAQNNEQLFNEPFRAWEYGPVNNTIWQKYKNYGGNAIKVDKPSSSISDNDIIIIFLTLILNTFGNIEQQKLIDYTHVDSPWSSKFINGENKELSIEEIKVYFKNFTGFNEYIEVNNNKVEFSKLLKCRKEYTRGLLNIGDSWISGKANAPSNSVVDVTNNFLDGLEKFIFAREAKPEIPRIIMGPIPSGGIGIDLKKTNKNMYIYFYNNESVEINTEDSYGKFTEIERTIEEFNEEFSIYLEDFI